MRRVPGRRALACVSLLAVLGAESTDALAQQPQCMNPLVSTCINSDTYWPHAGPQRFATVGGTETVASGQVAFGLVTSYLSRPIVIQGPSPGGSGTRHFAVDDQVNANFLFAYGVTDRLQLDVGLPITLVQTGSGTSPLTGGRTLRDTAVRDMRFGFAYALVPRQRTDLRKAAEEGGPGKGFSVATRLGFVAPIGDDSDFAGERSMVLAPSVAADYRVWRTFFGAEIGARLRPVTELAGTRIGSQLTTALGAGIDILQREMLSFLVEGRAYVNFPEQYTTQQSAFGITTYPNGKRIVPAEWFVGLRSAPVLDGDISFFGGGGGPIPLADDPITVPRFRFVLGVTYAPIRRDSDGDGVPDRIDRCPTTPGVRGGERPGCPPTHEIKTSPSELEKPGGKTTSESPPSPPREKVHEEAHP